MAEKCIHNFGRNNSGTDLWGLEECSSAILLKQ